MLNQGAVEKCQKTITKKFTEKSVNQSVLQWFEKLEKKSSHFIEIPQAVSKAKRPQFYCLILKLMNSNEGFFDEIYHRISEL